MSDSIKELTAKIRTFSLARGWSSDESKKDLAISIAIEAAELMERFQWVKDSAVDAHVEKERIGIGEELADVLIYAFEFAEKCGINIGAAIEDKMEKNAKKYPAKK